MSEILTILGALAKADVRFVVAGGVAVVLHGFPRFTADIDLVVDLERANILKAVGALQELGYHPRAPVAATDFAEEGTREAWIRDKGMKVFSLWSSRLPGTEVDIFAEDPFPFEAGYERAERVTVQGLSFRIVAVADLIAMKEAAGRDKDLLDLKVLRGLLARKKSEGPADG
jgi:hypothetical protein